MITSENESCIESRKIQSASQIGGVTYTAAVLAKRDRDKRVLTRVRNYFARKIFTRKKIFESRLQNVARVNAALGYS